MAAEDFTTFTEVDPNGRISKTSSRVTWTLLQRDEDAYVYKDKGASFFNGDFVFELDVRLTGGSNNGFVYYWALANLVDDAKGIQDASGDSLGIIIKIGSAVSRRIVLEEVDGGSAFGDGAGFEIPFDTTFFLTIKRDESLETHGKIFLFIYSDSGRTTLVDTQSITLHSSKKDFRYLYGCQSFNAATAETLSAFTENLEFFSPPVVTTQAMTNVVGFTATGNGNITSIGDDSVTAHGHVYNTTGTPDLSDTVVDNGAAAGTGAYTTPISGLLPQTKYFFRAFATNSFGTSFGAEVTATTPRGGRAIFPQIYMLVDWDLDGDFTDAESDITSDVIGTTRVTHGKVRELAKATASFLSFTVNNATHKYSPPNSSSILNQSGNSLTEKGQVRFGYRYPFDEFTDSDDVTLANHIPSSPEVPWTEESGTWLIDTNKVKETAGAGIAVMDFGEANAHIEVDYTFGGGPSSEDIIIFRFTDTSNFLYIRITPGTSTLEVRKVDGGADSQVATATQAWASSATKTVKVILHGEEIYVLIDLSLKISTSDTHNETATKHGMGGPNTDSTSRWDTFGGNYALFYGTLDKVQPLPSSELQTALITCSNNFKNLAKYGLFRQVWPLNGIPDGMRGYLQEITHSVPNIAQLGDIMDQGITPAGDPTTKIWWRVTALSACQQIAIDENGFFYQDQDGFFRFEAKGHRAASPHDAAFATFYPEYATNGIGFTNLKWTSGDEDIVNQVSVNVQILEQVSPSSGEIWRSIEADVLEGDITSSLLSIPGSSSIIIFFESKDFDLITGVITPSSTPSWEKVSGRIKNGPFKVGETITFSPSAASGEIIEVDGGEVTYKSTGAAFGDEGVGQTTFATLTSYQKVFGIIVGGPFTQGELVNTDVSGSTGLIVEQSSVSITLDETSGAFNAGDTFTGATSGATLNGSPNISDDRTTITSIADYAANAQANGGGADKTAQLSIAVAFPQQLSYGRGAKLTLTNSDGSTIYVTKLRVRGIGDVLQPKVEAIVEDSTSAGKYGESGHKVDGHLITTYADAKVLADDIETKEDDPRAKVEISLINANKETLTQILARKISDRITLNYSAMGLNEDFYINRMEYEISEGGMAIRAKLLLEEVS